MLNMFLKVLGGIWTFARLIVYPVVALLVLFFLLCGCHLLYQMIVKKRKIPKTGQIKQRRPNLIWSFLFHVPRRYVLDLLDREEGYFHPKGIHIFCGEQGSGKSIAAVEMMLRLKKQYPHSKMITNFEVKGEDDTLDDWRKLINYTNGRKGVIVGMDEIQNWFQSGNVKLPEEMLEVATQNRKNHRIICATAQVFTRVNKALREQVFLVYSPLTLFGCYTVVLVRKPKFDDEGNVTGMKFRKLYGFVHTDEIRNAYDTEKVIHTLVKEGVKEKAVVIENNTYQVSPKKMRVVK